MQEYNRKYRRRQSREQQEKDARLRELEAQQVQQITDAFRPQYPPVLNEEMEQLQMKFEEVTEENRRLRLELMYNRVHTEKLEIEQRISVKCRC